MTVRKIYENLQNGKQYGETIKAQNPAIGKTLFFGVLSLSEDGEYIRYRNFGSSAVKNNISDLSWVLTVIFKMTAQEFAEKYEIR